jgi:SAM-dependent methyltransferase
MQNSELKEIYNKGELQFYPGFNESKMLIDLMSPDDWRGKSVLEIGCGEGHLAAMLGYAGAHVLATDYAEDQIDRAQAQYSLKNVTFRVAQAPLGTWDVIVMQGVLEHLDNPFTYLENLIENNLNKDGKIIFSTPNWCNPRGLIYHTCRLLMDARMSLTDIHFFSISDFEAFALKMRGKISVTSCDYELAGGRDMITDLTRRIPLAAPDTPLVKIKTLMEFAARQLPWMKPGELMGANIGYKMEWKSGAMDDSHLVEDPGLS